MKKHPLKDFDIMKGEIIVYTDESQLLKESKLLKVCLSALIAHAGDPDTFNKIYLDTTISMSINNKMIHINDIENREAVIFDNNTRIFYYYMGGEVTAIIKLPIQKVSYEELADALGNLLYS